MKETQTIPFDLRSDFKPAGDQPTAIQGIVDSLKKGEQDTVLLGVTGSGKTFTMAHVIKNMGRPAIIMAPNKTLAAQLYAEMKAFFPNNAVEYFVSYYDYYQPEAYVARSDTFIEKESSINEQIDRMRHSATRSLIERRDVILVASVSCIYGIGSPDAYSTMSVTINKGEDINREDLIRQLVLLQYTRNELSFVRGTFRARGDSLEIFPAHMEETGWRLSLFDEEVEEIVAFDPLTGEIQEKLDTIRLFPNSHYVTPQDKMQSAAKHIKEDLKVRLEELRGHEKLLEAQRLEQRTQFDLEMIYATGSCNGIENYSRYLTGRQEGEPPPTLFEYLPKDALLFLDESHVTVSQIGAMYKGDRSRKTTLVEHGFRLPSAKDNRPLKFEEWEDLRPQTIHVSATPGDWELEKTQGVFYEQVVRPTGLVDPITEIRPTEHQVDDLMHECHKVIANEGRILVTTLTKKMAEHLTEYLNENGLRVQYLHSDVDTLERIEIIQNLRLGEFDILVGINLLREGLDIPECKLVAILDADKEGFLRSRRSLIQTIGRAARNAEARAILYADKITNSMKAALDETDRRRQKQMAHNEEHGITPQTVKKAISNIVDEIYDDEDDAQRTRKARAYGLKPQPQAQTSVMGMAEEAASYTPKTPQDMKKHLESLEKQMRQAAADLDFETAARLRDQIKALESQELGL